MTLAKFLLARIAEDDADARRGVGWAHRSTRWGRALAECEAKRRIVEEFNRIGSMSADEAGDGGASAMTLMDGLEIAMRLLALPYVDHPDYDAEWRS
jgi:hypothetical protein